MTLLKYQYIDNTHYFLARIYKTTFHVSVQKTLKEESVNFSLVNWVLVGGVLVKPMANLLYR